MFKRNQNFSSIQLSRSIESGKNFSASATVNHFMNFKSQISSHNFCDHIATISSTENFSGTDMASNFAFTNQTAIATDVAMNDLAPVAKNICSEFIGNETFHADARIESNIIDDTLLYTQITFTSIIMMTSNEIGDDVRDTFNRTLTVSGNPDAAITE